MRGLWLQQRAMAELLELACRGEGVQFSYHILYSTLCYREFGTCWARKRPGAKVGSYGAPVCFRADFATAAKILMRCTIVMAYARHGDCTV